MKNFSEFGERQEREDATGQSRANHCDAAWLAGIFDGEGNFHVVRPIKGEHYVAPQMVITNTSLLMLDKVQRIVKDLSGYKHNITFVKRNDTQEHWKQCYKIFIARQKTLEAVIEAMLPHLTAKKSQAEEVLIFIRSRLSRKTYHSGYTEEELGLKERVKDARLRPENLTVIRGGVEIEREALN